MSISNYPQKVVISVKDLFEHACKEANVDPSAVEHINATYCVIHKTHSEEDGYDYYDLSEVSLSNFKGNTRTGIAAMDGEVCVVEEKQKGIVFLKEVDEEIPFRLTLEEFDISCTPVREKEDIPASYTIIRDGKVIELTEAEVARLAEQYDKNGYKAWISNFVKDMYSAEQAGVFLKSGGLNEVSTQLYEAMEDYSAESEERAEYMNEQCREQFDTFMQNKAREYWEDFEDIPMNPETECIEEDFLDFRAGTHREEIWHWFEDTFDLSVAKDLMYEEPDKEI